MTMAPRRRALAVPALFLLLSGCLGGLLGGGKEADLYRFGGAEAAAAPSGQLAPGIFKVQLVMPGFPPEAAGDRILTVEDNRASYIEGARWVSSAPALYRSALAARFAEAEGDVPILERRRGDADYVLRVRIDRFEADYANGPKAPPTVHVAGIATLFDREGKEIASYRAVDSDAATANRTGAIVAAFDRAVMRQSAAVARWASGAMRGSGRG